MMETPVRKGGDATLKNVDTFNKKGNLTNIIIVLALLATPLSHNPLSAEENKVGYAGAALSFPVGEMQIGESTVWTESGLTSAHVIYKEDPNGFELKWKQVQISLADGSSITARAIESQGNSNYISVVSGPEHKISWIPFEAIESLNIKTAEPLVHVEARTMEEVYGRFRFVTKLAEIGDLALSIRASLTHPLKSGERFFEGYLLEKQLKVLDDGAWRELAWESVRKVEIRRDGAEKNPATGSSGPPKFLYRDQSEYSNVWREYSFPKQ